MSTGRNDPFLQPTGPFQAVSRKLGHIRWNVLRLVQKLKSWLKRKKGCEYWECPWGYCSGEVKLRHSMTAYPRTTDNPNPNRDFLCCDGHHKDYVDHWNEMWDEYYSSQGYPRKR